MSGTGDMPPLAIVTTYHSLAAATKIIIERDEEIAELIRERDEAEARGFERGVREAAKQMDLDARKTGGNWSTARAAILALLEPTEPKQP
jgi:phosphate uptake regulator